MGYCNWASILSIVIVAYISIAFHQLYKLMNPLDGVDLVGPFIEPLWREEESFDMFTFLSTKPRLSAMPAKSWEAHCHLLLERRQLAHSQFQTLQEDLLTIPLHSNASSSSLMLEAMARAIHRNKSDVYFHVLLSRSKGLSLSDLLSQRSALASAGELLHGTIQMVKYDVIPKYFHYRYLLSDLGLAEVSPEDYAKQTMSSSTIITYWKPEVSIKLVNDFNRYPITHVPEAVAMNHIRPGKRRNAEQSYYRPSLHADEIGLTSDKYIPLNATVEKLPLKITFGPMSSQRWILMSQLEAALKAQKGMGFSDKDIDDMRRLISDTSIVLLTATIVATVLHFIFEVLAFRSDISFWQSQEKHVGISLLSVLTSLLSQIIVFFYLISNESTSLLITIPAFVGIIVQAWKVRRACGFTVKWGAGYLPMIHFDRLEKSPTEQVVELKEKKDEVSSDSLLTSIADSSDVVKKDDIDYETVSLEADAFAYRIIGLFMAPLVVSFVLYSLIYEKYISWWSFLVSSLTGCVYSFGFVLMLPQLYINHRLQSVSHLPWKFLAYKFINTFIDDLFAFIIKMPTMHRLSVFRDDIVFVVYLYQRYIYRIDKSRPVEK
eukprot:gene5018-5510_t